MKTNVGRSFLQIMDKHFPPGNPLNQIFNRNKVKMSYRCTANLASSTQNNEEPKKECNCRKKNECLVQGKCLQSGVIYQATVTRQDDRVDTYIGLSCPL